MKNNCDVSGKYGDRTECSVGTKEGGCSYWSERCHMFAGSICNSYASGTCTSLAAIRAAIESEKNDEE